MAELVGVDVGGTFTDFVWLVDGRLRVHKVPTTPDDPSRAVAAGLEVLGVDAGADVVHGTTTATNALLERRGARTALVTTEGFADVLVLARQQRPALYALAQERPPPLVPRDLRLEVPERLAADGSVLVPLDEDAVRAAGRRLADAGAESVAVVFLMGHRDGAHERRAAELLREALPGVPLTLASRLLPEHREYERTATTVVNAYLRPVVEAYLERLEAAVGGRSVRVMQSSGGVLAPGRAAVEAARLVLSGPAGGVVGAVDLARRALGGAPRIVTLDMGGTSTDVALCAGAVPFTAESEAAGLPLRLPAVDVHTVGAGGGSLARVDAGGALRVGPESAGAVPGPACYGRGGTRPTVTDAHVVLGRLVPDAFLGGEGQGLDAGASRTALARLAGELGVSVEAAALGVVRVAEAAMERALRRVSVERGHDPGAYTLVPFGGAGPLHACALAEALGMRRVLVPRHPGVLSAHGLLLADVVYDVATALLQPAAALAAHPAPLAAALAALRRQVRAGLGAGPDPALHAALDLRYAGQSYELTVPLALPADGAAVEAAAEAFHAEHARRYGHADATAPVEVVTARLRGTRPGARPAVEARPCGPADAAPALLSHRPVWFGADAPTDTPCYARDALRPGMAFAGPALVLQYDATCVAPPGWHARVDAYDNLELEGRGGRLTGASTVLPCGT